MNVHRKNVTVATTGNNDNFCQSIYLFVISVKWTYLYVIIVKVVYLTVVYHNRVFITKNVLMGDI